MTGVAKNVKNSLKEAPSPCIFVVLCNIFFMKYIFRNFLISSHILIYLFWVDLLSKFSSLSSSISKRRTINFCKDVNVLLIVTILLDHRKWWCETHIAFKAADNYCRRFLQMLSSTMHVQSRLETTTKDLVPASSEESLARFLTYLGLLSLIAWRLFSSKWLKRVVANHSILSILTREIEIITKSILFFNLVIKY